MVTDRTRSEEPWFVLTGPHPDGGRPRAHGAGLERRDGARALFRSARRLKALPEHLEVLPGAYSGSVCGRGLSGKPTSTIGFEKRSNRAFRDRRRGGVRAHRCWPTSRRLRPRPPGPGRLTPGGLRLRHDGPGELRGRARRGTRARHPRQPRPVPAPAAAGAARRLRHRHDAHRGAGARRVRVRRRPRLVPAADRLRGRLRRREGRAELRRRPSLRARSAARTCCCSAGSSPCRSP